MSHSTITSKAMGTFHGGIHPPEFKSLSNQAPIKSIQLPKELVIPLQQHIGSTAIATVSVGDKVSQGQLIAAEKSTISANIHAPANGIITAIEDCYTGHPSGIFKPAIIIQTDSNPYQTSKTTEADHEAHHEEHKENHSAWHSQPANELLQQIKSAGIVGLGGATFPTHVKLSTQKINQLIINAMECEPYITCDDRLLQENAQQVVEGALITAKVVAVNEVIFAIEDNKPQALTALEKAITDTESNLKIRIIVAPTKYPSGGEKQMLELIFNKQIPNGQLPSSLGVVVQNVATVHAIYKTISEQQMLTQRLVTITGDQVDQPGNYWLPFGIKIQDLMTLFNITDDQCKQVILGGPLMGQSIKNFAMPITKSVNCIIFNQDQKNIKPWLTESQAHQPCIRCSDCEKVCPVELLPQQLFWFSQGEQWEQLQQQGLFDCIECGACAYVCPSEIPLVQYFRFAKSNIQQQQIKKEKSDIAKQRFDFREMRLERAKSERALKHKKAAEARRKAAEAKSSDPTGKQTAINQALQRVKQKQTDAKQEKQTGDKS